MKKKRFEVTEKVCKVCDQLKAAKFFAKVKSSLDGLQSWCNQCTGIYSYQRYKAKGKKNYSPINNYKISNEKEYNQYQKEYQKQYREDPIKRKKQHIAHTISNAIKRGKFVRPVCNCQECDAENKKVFAYFTNKFVQRLMRKYKTIKLEHFIDKAQWLCFSCIIKKRDNK